MIISYLIYGNFHYDVNYGVHYGVKGGVGKNVNSGNQLADMDHPIRRHLSFKNMYIFKNEKWFFLPAPAAEISGFRKYRKFRKSIFQRVGVIFDRKFGILAKFWPRMDI